MPAPEAPTGIQPPRITQPIVAPVSNGPWEPELERSSASAGVDVNLMRRVATTESGNNTNARARTSTAGGLFQIIDGTWNDLSARYPQLGLTNRMDPIQQARVAPFYMKEINENLTRVVGRAPTAAESKLGWVFGPTGGAMILKASPDTPVDRVLDTSAIASNPGIFKKVRTVGDLYAWAGGTMGEEGAHPKPRIDLKPFLAPGHDAEHLDKMDWDLKSRLANMVADMPENLRAKFQINSGFRSPERQAELFAAAVKKYGSEEAARKWVAPPGNSMHNHGRAADLNMNGDPAVKEWLHANASKYGLGFPMSHEPWHIEALDARASKIARMGMTSDPVSTSQRIPFTREDDRQRVKAEENKAYSLVQAAQASATQDWMIANALKSNNKAVYDPGFDPASVPKNEDVKALDARYLPYLSKAMSEQDLDFRIRQAQGDAERESRLAATRGGILIRLATGMADPAGLALSAIAPVGALVQGSRMARLGAAAADGAIGALASETPAMVDRPGYETQEALWAGVMGTAGYLALNRSAWKGTHVEETAEQAVKSLHGLRTELESGTAFSNKSAGAAAVPWARDPVRSDTYELSLLKTEASGDALVNPLRFDMARHKNSPNPLVASLTDNLVQDTIGNKNTSKAVSIPVEAQARQLEERANTVWSREYEAATADYRKRNNISWYDWQAGKEVEFQREISYAVRNTDPLTQVDPAVQQMASSWQKQAEHWRELARNPGKERGETMRPLPGAEDWADNPNYLPRYTNWGRFNELNMEHGNELRRLLGTAIERKNPDLDPKFAAKLGSYYYDRLAKVDAGQELSTMKALSGSDVEALRADLVRYGLDEVEVNQALYQLEQKAGDGKSMTSRQKRRTVMDENFKMTLEGRNGPREVAIADLWEDNMHSIVHAYNKQMSGAVAMAQLRIENPKWHPDGDGPKYLVDGVHSEGDWQKLEAQARALDKEFRPEDGGKRIETELADLRFAFDAIRGVPHNFDRTQLGQAMRVIQKVNFVRLMSQAGWSSVAEFGRILGEFGVKHMLQTIPTFRDFMRDARTGKLLRDELEDWEYAFTSGTDHLRGSGMTWQGSQVASAMNDGASKRAGGFLDRAEQITSKASRYTSMVSLAPLTTFQERWAMKAAVSKFRAAALEDGALSEKRMRLIGLDDDMQKRVLKEIKTHNSTIEGENGRKVEILGLEKWEPQVRSAFEHAITTWTRRTIQQNDLGQMNAMLGSPMAKLLFQFRNFTIGAWSKQTLSAVHNHELNDLFGFMASMLFGAMAYTVQTNLSLIGLSEEDRKKAVSDRLSDAKIAMAGFQRAGASSLIPGAFDFGAGIAGFDPWFNTRSTQQPSAGLLANPTAGLVDDFMKGIGGVTGSFHEGGKLVSGDVRNLSRALNVLHNYPLMIQTINATSSLLPAK
nr:D-alanyl-D-alanine carboxypeptidase family protein [Methylobacterium gossipiicola]